eukprot:m.292099 g.292099  ORF g.292099 m.292099 type:complete len:3100 (+) comp40730_c1_seq7:4098-13397(+)
MTTSTDQQIAANSLYESGVKKFQQRHFDEAVEDFEQSLHLYNLLLSPASQLSPDCEYSLAMFRLNVVRHLVECYKCLNWWWEVYQLTSFALGLQEVKMNLFCFLLDGQGVFPVCVFLENRAMASRAMEMYVAAAEDYHCLHLLRKDPKDRRNRQKMLHQQRQSAEQRARVKQMFCEQFMPAIQIEEASAPVETKTKRKRGKSKDQGIKQYQLKPKSKKELQREQRKRQKEGEELLQKYVEGREAKRNAAAANSQEKPLSSSEEDDEEITPDPNRFSQKIAESTSDQCARVRIEANSKPRKKHAARKRREEALAKKENTVGHSGNVPVVCASSETRPTVDGDQAVVTKKVLPAILLENLVTRLPSRDIVNSLGFQNPIVIQEGVLACRFCYNFLSKKVKVDPDKGMLSCKKHSEYSRLPVLLWRKQSESGGSAWVSIRPRPRKVAGEFSVCNRPQCVGQCTFAHSEEEKTAWNLDRGLGVSNCRLPPAKHRLAHCKEFKMGVCRHGKYCWRAHGDEELQQWKEMAAIQPMLSAVKCSVVEKLSQEMREALRKEDYSKVASSVDGVQVFCVPAENWKFVSSDENVAPFCCDFKFNVCSSKEAVKRVILIQEDENEELQFQLASSVGKRDSRGCCLLFQEKLPSKSVQFDVKFTLQSNSHSSVASRSVDMIIDCSPLPYIVQRLHVSVGRERDRHSVDQLRLIAESPPEQWEVNIDSVVGGPLSRPIGKQEELKLPDFDQLRDDWFNLVSKGSEVSTIGYVKRFHTLLHLEESECQKNLQIFSRIRVSLECGKNGRFTGLRTVRLGCAVPPRIAQESIAYLRLSDDPAKVYLVPISEVRDFGAVEVDVSRNQELRDRLAKEESEDTSPLVDFQIKHDRTHFLNLHFGVKKLPRKILRRYVCPSGPSATQSHPRDNLEEFLSKLKSTYPSPVWENAEQAEAVTLICQRPRSSHVLVNGPFGTGKTLLLKEAVRLMTLLDKKATILVCTQSNHAADLYIQQLAKSDGFSAKLVRIYYRGRRVNTVPRDVLKYCQVRYTKDGHGYFLEPNLSELCQYPPLVVVTTLATAGVLKADDAGRDSFSLIVIDEAAQATEPESIIPLSLANEKTTLVLAGDHRQINPPVSSRYARRGKLQRSLFRRLYHLLPGLQLPVVDLHVNYRCHRQILGLAVKLFYGGLADSDGHDKAIAGLAQAKDQHPHPEFHPFGFVALSPGAAVQQGGNDGSYVNSAEAMAVIYYLKCIKEGWPFQWGALDLSEVCVVSSESMQVKYIRQLLFQAGLKGVTVLTSRSIQGKQFRAVLISTVMTSKGDIESYQRESTLFSDKKMLNTAMTRARSLVLAFGEIDSLVKCKIGKTWELFINEAWKAGPKSLLGDKATSKFLEDFMQRRALDPGAQPFVPGSIPAQVSSPWQREVASASGLAEISDDEDDDESSDSEGGPSTVESYQRYIHKTASKWNRLRRDAAPSVDNADDDVDLEMVETEELEDVRWELRRGRRRGRVAASRRLADDSVDGDDTKRALKYQPHMNIDQMEEALSKNPKKYIRCHLKVLGRGDDCRGIPVDSDHNEVLIEGYRRRNRTFDGEEVLVEIISTDEDGVVVGKVVGIFRQQRPTHFVCRLYEKKTNMLASIDSAHPIFINCPSKLRDSHQQRHGDCVVLFHSLLETGKVRERIKDCVKLRTAATKSFVVEFVKWEDTHTYPLGLVVDVIEPGPTFEQGLRLLDIQCIGYNELKKYEKETDSVSEDPENLDDGVIQNAFTIDPPQAKDLDDALAVKVLGRTETTTLYQVDVFIADVDSIVPFGSDLEKRARALGTSVYMNSGGVRLPMLPKSISNNKGSLLPGVCRRVICTSFVVDDSGKLQKAAKFSSEVIQSCCKLSYESAERVIRGETPDLDCSVEIKPRLLDDIRLLHRLSQNIRSHRLGKIVKAFRDSAAAHELVEEFMILTNQMVAKKLLGDWHSRNRCILNSQHPPSESKLRDLAKLAGRYAELSPRLYDALRKAKLQLTARRDWRLDISKEKFQELSRGTLLAGDTQAIEKMVRFVCCESLHPQLAMWLTKCWRTMQRAQYTTFYTDPDFPSAHYEFNTTYCHFTSPLRRFVDLVTHRLLKTYVLRSGEFHYDSEDVGKIALDCSYRRRLATKHENESATLKFASDVHLYPVSTVAVVESVAEGYIELFVADCPHFPSKAGRIRLSSLNAAKIDVTSSGSASVGETVEVKWKVDLLTDPRQRRPSVELLLPQEKYSSFHPDLWGKLFKTVARCTEGNDIKKQLTRAITQMEKEAQLFTSKVKSQSLSQETPDEKEKFLIKKFISVNDLLSIQVASRMKRGLLQPYVQLLNFPGGLSICLEHNTGAAECFAPSISVASHPSSFRSYDDYVSFWMPLIEVESATASVKSSGTATPRLINNLVVCWTDEWGVGKLQMGKRYAEGNKIAHKVGDYVCLRYFNLKLPESERASRKEEGSLWQRNSFFGHSDRYHVVVHCQVVDRSADDRSEMDKYDENITYELTLQTTGSSDDLKLNFGKLSGLPCVAQFIHSSLPFSRMMQSLRGCKHNELLHGVVMGNFKGNGGSQRNDPVDDRKRRSLPEILGQSRVLNLEQYEAVRRSLNNRITLIQGPPGTGKTVTGIHIAWWLSQQNVQKSKGWGRNQLYYCAPSNEAVDLVARKLRKVMMQKIDQTGVETINLLRVYGGAIESQAYPGLSRFERYAPAGIPVVLKTDCKEIQDITLHHRIRDLSHLNRELRKLAAEIRWWDERFAEYKEKIPTEEEAEKYNKLLNSAKELEINASDVILCTCVQAGSGRLTESSGRVLQCIVDEAGQCTEPETLVAIVRAQSKIVLIGDHMQLQPVIQDSRVEELLNISMFERLAKKATMLTEQYRMHKELCSFPSEMFYEGKLETAKEVQKRQEPIFWQPCWRHLKMPLMYQKPRCFINIAGKEAINSVPELGKGGEESKSNLEEADLVVHIVRSMCHSYDIAPRQLRVLTPYTAQKYAIEKKLKSKFPFASDVRVCSIFESQGGEADFVILSTVRSLPDCRIIESPSKYWKKENIGFLADEHQINVALTRAKHGLIVVGNEKLLKYCTMWDKLLMSYKADRCFLSTKEAKEMFFFR